MRRAVMIVGLAVLALGCTGEDANPLGGSTSSLPAHAVTPTPEMEELARQQCFDDPDLATGVIQVVEPDSEAVVARVEVDCVEARAAQPEN